MQERKAHLRSHCWVFVLVKMQGLERDVSGLINRKSGPSSNVLYTHQISEDSNNHLIISRFRF